MEDLIEDRLASLLHREIDQLSLLPEHQSEVVELEGREITLTTFHQALSDNRHRIVVQGIRERWGGITARVIARGFELDDRGAVRLLTPEDLYDYT